MHRLLTETYSIGHTDNPKIDIHLLVNHEAGRINITPKSGNRHFLFENSDPEFAQQVAETIAEAARYGYEQLERGKQDAQQETED